jgi:hypothetical protein
MKVLAKTELHLFEIAALGGDGDNARLADDLGLAGLDVIANVLVVCLANGCRHQNSHVLADQFVALETRQLQQRINNTELTHALSVVLVGVCV